jgi:hypothetical protein
MATKFATNYPIPSATNVFSVVWKLTRIMKAAGWTYKASGNGTTKDTSGTASSDLWGGNANPLLDTYPSLDSPAAWWVASGPVTLKIPITTAPTGTPLRGETITQATSSAEGELVGYVYDSSLTSGWMVVLPRVGTFNNSNVITGSTSGATFTPNGTIVTYTREVCFSKAAGSTVNGNIYYVCADASGESSSLFSTLSTSSGCTATVHPGGGGTGNSFPSIAICIRGTGGSTSGSDTLFGGNNTINSGANSQIGAANATPSTGVSADGTFYIACTSNTVGTMTGFMYCRLDDTEPGDVDPFVWFHVGGNPWASWSRTSNTSYGSVQYTFWGQYNSGLFAPSYPCLWAYQARGASVTSRDTSSPYAISVGYAAYNGTALVFLSGGAGSFKTLNHPNTTTPIVREPVTVYTPGIVSGTNRQIKGRCRWMSAYSFGNIYDTYDSKTWLVVSSAASNGVALAIGPYDGTSTPAA